MGGVEIAEGEYETRTPTTPADRALLGWGRSLDENEFLSVLLLEAASHHCGSNRFDQATALVDRVIALQPERIDVKLWRLRLEAIRTSDRAAFRRHVAELLYTADLSPSVAAGAILDLAAELGATGDHETERLLLMRAFAVAPKTKQQQILHRLAFCLRALKDFRGAVRYMELALMMEDDPQGAGMASHLYNLAILQKNDGQLSQALDSIARGRELNPESWSLKIINAGYLVLNGQVEEGEALFARIKDEKPRGREEFYNIMIAWFYAVSEQREQFYAAFTHALEQSRTVGVLHWIDQDVDLDIYRNEPEFQALVRKHRARILGQTEEADEPELKPTGGRSEPAATPDAGSDRTRKVLAQ
jgi:tetratricopeptide (TPR) repeat protein